LETPPRSRKTILIVDDQPQVRRLLHQILDREGYAVIEGEDEATAWQAVRNNPDPVDLALIDIDLPGLGGRDVAANLQMFGPMKVLFISGLDVGKLVADGRLEKGAPIVQKPFTVAGVLEAVRAHLASS
jgi:two-component system, cell cycle sensor histidine kinase and response regulator CckA